MKLRQFSGSSLPAANLTILIKGQLLLRPAPNSSSCKINVNSITASPHRLTILVDAKFPDGRRERIVQPLPVPLQADVLVEIEEQSQGVSGFFVGNPSANFDRFANNDRQDLRWAIDLENKREFHDFPRNLTCTSENERGILLRDGVFYTADLSNPSSLYVRRHRGGGTDNLPLNKVAGLIGNRIHLEGNQTILIKWGEGADQAIHLPRPAQAQPPRPADPRDTQYTMTVRNDPDELSTEPSHDELVEYYQVVRKPNGDPFQSNEKFHLDMVQLDSGDGDRIPCCSVFLEM